MGGASDCRDKGRYELSSWCTPKRGWREGQGEVQVSERGAVREERWQEIAYRSVAPPLIAVECRVAVIATLGQIQGQPVKEQAQRALGEWAKRREGEGVGKEGRRDAAGSTRSTSRWAARLPQEGAAISPDGSGVHLLADGTSIPPCV